MKNRLSKNTCDFVVIMKLPKGTISEYQICYNINSVENEFNHKLYELNRTTLFTPITNLYLNHNKWSNEIFDELL